MTEASISEAESDLSQLIQRALAGEEVIIADDGKPMIRLVPILAPLQSSGLAKWDRGPRLTDFDAEMADFGDCIPRQVRSGSTSG